MATITGTLWTDADASTTFDSTEPVLKSTAVYLDLNVNGRFDASEPQALTSKTGVYEFDDLAAGSYLVAALAPAGNGQTSPGRFGGVRGTFDVTLAGISQLSAVERRAFASAARRIESVITGDLPNANGIDDVRISVSVDSIDGPGGTLAEAGPTRTRVGSGLPYAGELSIDTADVDDMISEGHFVDTITHEMLHVLGFGTIWGDLGLISGEGTRNPRFLGKAATKAYNTLFRTTGTSVPLESTGGDGTADGHWPESTFAEELMTGYDEGRNVEEPLSAITVGALADMGYTVNSKAADTWNPLTHTTTLTTPLDLGARPFEKRVTIGRDDSVTVNIGFRADTAPRVRGASATPAILGESTTLTVSSIVDAEGDDIAGVSYYLESNGVSGLQGGRGGDNYLGGSTDASIDYRVLGSTAAAAAGTATFYAVATDALGLAGRASTTTTLTAPPPPTRPNPVVATRISRSTALLQWKDRSTNEIGFRVELLTDDGTVSKAFNVPTNTVSADLLGLTRGVFYTARVRSYGYGGVSAYTRAERFRI